MHNFRLYLENTQGKANERFTISVNDCIIGKYTLDNDLVEFDCELRTGWNDLRILFNRRIPDASVKIDEVYIDQSAMKYLLNDFGQVVPNWTAEPMLKKWYVDTQGHAPDCFPKRKILDMSGVYEFRFQLPLREFLEDFYQIPEHYRKQYNQPLEHYSKLENILNAKN
jgi:hypothetical protein